MASNKKKANLANPGKKKANLASASKSKKKASKRAPAALKTAVQAPTPTEESLIEQLKSGSKEPITLTLELTPRAVLLLGKREVQVMVKKVNPRPLRCRFSSFP